MSIDKQLGSWSRILPALDSDYLNKLGVFINGEYKSKQIHPNKEDIFKAFRLCHYDDLKVVIIGKDPYPNNKSTGIAFGNRNDDTQTSPSLMKIWEAVEKDCADNKILLDFDVTLESWCKQGVLMLNKSLTVKKFKSGSHLIYWDKFTKGLLKYLSEYNSGIVYCLWGSEARSLAPYIDPRSNYILQCTHPSYAIKQNDYWKCNHFSSINRFLMKNNGEEINWGSKYEE